MLLGFSWYSSSESKWFSFVMCPIRNDTDFLKRFTKIRPTLPKTDA